MQQTSITHQITDTVRSFTCDMIRVHASAMHDISYMSDYSEPADSIHDLCICNVCRDQLVRNFDVHDSIILTDSNYRAYGLSSLTIGRVITDSMAPYTHDGLRNDMHALSRFAVGVCTIVHWPLALLPEDRVCEGREEQQAGKEGSRERDHEEKEGAA
eukprot:991792-Pleurochrysis_carterae.AAC.1